MLSQLINEQIFTETLLCRRYCAEPLSQRGCRHTHTNKQQVESLIAGGSKAALESQASGRQLLTSSAANKLVAKANHLPTGPGSVSSCVK